MHKRFEELNEQLRLELKETGSRFRVEVEQFRDAQRIEVARNARCSLGLDVVVYLDNKPIKAFDLKTYATQARGFSATKLRELQNRFQVPIDPIFRQR